MPASITDLISDIRETSMPTAGGDLHLSYRPKFYTLKLERAMRAAREDQRQAESFVDLFLRFVTTWDLTDATGAVIPLTVEGLEDVPINALADITTHCFADLNPPEASSASSSASSSRTA